MTSGEEKEEPPQVKMDEKKIDRLKGKMSDKRLRLEQDDRNVEFVVGNKHILIQTEHIPYFKALIDFRRRAGQEKENESYPTHRYIPYLDIINDNPPSYYHRFFCHMPPDVKMYRGLCESMDFLCIDVLKGRTLQELYCEIRDSHRPSTYIGPLHAKWKREKSRQAAFCLLFVLLVDRLDSHDQGRSFNTAFLAVLHIVSNPQVFSFGARKVIREAFEERFNGEIDFKVTEKQRSRLQHWPIVEPEGKDYVRDGYDQDESICC